MMRERPVRFGPGDGLRGIVTDAAGEMRPAGRPAFLMVNAGLVHHVGPARLHVTLARRLAERGTTCLRFDRSAIGDSDGRRDGLAGQAASVRDVQDAMDFLRRTRGIVAFILFGICAGAQVAFESAKADRRIVGLVSIDGYAYRTARYYWEYYRPRLFHRGPWAHFFREYGGRLMAALPPGRRPNGSTPRRSTFQVAFPPRGQVAADLDLLVAHGVRQFHILTAAHGGLYNYHRQFYDTFPSLDGSELVQVAYWPRTGHMFESLDAQAVLVREVLMWVDSVGGDGSSAGNGPQEGRTDAPARAEYVL